MQPKALSMTLLCLLGICASASADLADEQTVLRHYASIAHAGYADALATAHNLQQAVGLLIDQPDEARLSAARTAWKLARVPYLQTEVFRFGSAIVDEWEGKVNAWPLDEGLIDYVDLSVYGEDADDNPYFSANVIANETLKLSGREIDATDITKRLLREALHEVDEIEANVATGYHAVEFLLWGQDRNGTGPGAGQRPATDFDLNRCTGGHCARRAAYLTTATDLLVDDLRWMTAQWAEDGAARAALLDGKADQGLAAILTGMGSLSYGELAGERMRLGLMLHDPEEEQDCFSDNTHWSHYYNALGIQNVYTGRYRRTDESLVAGPSIADLLALQDTEADKALREALDATIARMQDLVDSAEQAGVAYDQLVAADNPAGNAKVQAAIDALLVQTKAIEQAIAALGIGDIAFAGSDSLDTPESVR